MLSEPLLHFLLIGAGLFLISRWRGEAATIDPAEQIVVSAGRIQQLATVFQKTWQRPPTREEIDGLIDDFVLEEVYYRKAVEMGIDRDDTIIRRRLRQKLEFLTDDASSLATPSDEDLAAYLREHPDPFRESPSYTFRQVYFNPEKHDGDPDVFLAEQLAALRSGDESLGDPTLIPESFDQSSRRVVDGTFGTGFAGELDELPLGQWAGPILSGLGVHLIYLDARTEGRLPDLAEIRPLVAREWSNDRRLETRRQINEELLKAYEVVIEWPQESTTANVTSDGSGG